MGQIPDTLPEIVKVKALRGFRGMVKGKYTNVNPGDVVPVDKKLAIELRISQKAVMTDEPEKIQEDYLPQRKRERIAMEAAQRSATLKAAGVKETAPAAK